MRYACRATLVVAALLAPLAGCVVVPTEHTYHRWEVEGIVVEPNGEPVAAPLVIGVHSLQDYRELAAIDLAGKGGSDPFRDRWQRVVADPDFRVVAVGNAVRLNFPHGESNGPLWKPPPQHWLTLGRGDVTRYTGLRLVRHPDPPATPPLDGRLTDADIVTIHAPDGRRIEVDFSRPELPGIVYGLYDARGNRVDQLLAPGTEGHYDRDFDSIWASVLKTRERWLYSRHLPAVPPAGAAVPVVPEVMLYELGLSASYTSNR